MTSAKDNPSASANGSQKIDIWQTNSRFPARNRFVSYIQLLSKFSLCQSLHHTDLSQKIPNIFASALGTSYIFSSGIVK